MLAPVDVKAEPWRCPERPVAACFKHHGRLSSQNGISLTIWLIGTTRRVGLANSFDDLPAGIQHYLVMTSPEHSYVYGDFDICPAGARHTGASQGGVRGWCGEARGSESRAGPAPVSAAIYLASLALGFNATVA